MSDPAKKTYAQEGLAAEADAFDDDAFALEDDFEFEETETAPPSAPAEDWAASDDLSGDEFIEEGEDWVEEEAVEPEGVASLADMDIEDGAPEAVEDAEPEFVEDFDHVEDDEVFEEPPLVEDEGVEGVDEFAAAASGEDRPVPRISIHAFCEHPETSTILEQAAADRRLAKAHVTIQMGGIDKAARHFSETPTPNLLILETVKRGGALLDDLGQLAEVCDPSTKVIVVGAVNDISLYRELIRQGVSEYLVRPETPLQFIRAISTLYVDPDAGPIGKTIAFVGSRGGVGSSTVAHNVGWAIAEDIEGDATIIDFDLSFGTAGLNFNQDPGQGVAEALSSPERLDDVLLDRLLVKCSDRLSLFAAPSALDRDYDYDTTAFESVIDVVRASTPYVILDVPHMWTPWTKRVLITSDQVVITATPDLGSLRNAKNIFDLITAARPNDDPPILVMNQVGVSKRPEIPVKDFAEAVSAEPALVLPWDPQLFGTAANNAVMAEDINPKHKASEGFRHLAVQVAGRDVARKRKTSLFARLLGKA